MFDARRTGSGGHLFPLPCAVGLPAVGGVNVCAEGARHSQGLTPPHGPSSGSAFDPTLRVGVPLPKVAAGSTHVQCPSDVGGYCSWQKDVWCPRSKHLMFSVLVVPLDPSWVVSNQKGRIPESCLMRRSMKRSVQSPVQDLFWSSKQSWLEQTPGTSQATYPDCRHHVLGPRRAPQ